MLEMIRRCRQLFLTAASPPASECITRPGACSRTLHHLLAVLASNSRRSVGPSMFPPGTFVTHIFCVSRCLEINRGSFFCRKLTNTGINTSAHDHCSIILPLCFNFLPVAGQSCYLHLCERSPVWGTPPLIILIFVYVLFICIRCKQHLCDGLLLLPRRLKFTCVG